MPHDQYGRTSLKRQEPSKIVESRNQGRRNEDDARFFTVTHTLLILYPSLPLPIILSAVRFGDVYANAIHGCNAADQPMTASPTGHPRVGKNRRRHWQVNL